MDPVTAGLITAGASAAISGGNAYAQGKMNKKNREFARESYELQRKDNRDDWLTKNAYDHPAAQIERLKAANLNPAMMYGSGSAANTSGQISGATQNVPHGQAPQLDVDAISTFTGTLMANRKFELDKRLVDAEVRLKDNQSLKALEETKLLSTDNETRSEINQRKSELYRAQGMNTWSQYDLNMNRGDTELVRKELLEKQVNLTQAKIDTENALREPNRNKALAQVANILAATDFFGAKKAQINAFINSQNWSAFTKEFDLYLKQMGIKPNSSDVLYFLGSGIKRAAYNFKPEEEKKETFKPIPLLKTAP